MKNVAKLVLFLSISFIVVLLFSGLITLLQGWTDEALLFPPATGISGGFSGKTVTYLESSIPVAFYLVILFGLTYAARHRIVYPAAFAVTLVFILILSGAAYFGLESLGKLGMLLLSGAFWLWKIFLTRAISVICFLLLPEE
ncbi:MAG: hypothetical protein FWG29_06065 [Treponema sp.]|nr:hypothetical protein [Treponema sp.]